MTKNLKKALSLLRCGASISEERFPTNYQRAMDIVHDELGPVYIDDTEPMTETEFHNEHSVEKEQE